MKISKLGTRSWNYLRWRDKISAKQRLLTVGGASNFFEKPYHRPIWGRFPLWHFCFQTGWNHHLENTGLLHSFIFGPTRFTKHLKDRPWTCSELGSDAKSNVFASLFWRPNRHVASFLFHRSRGVHCACSVWDLESVRLWFEMQN